MLNPKAIRAQVGVCSFWQVGGKLPPGDTAKALCRPTEMPLCKSAFNEVGSCATVGIPAAHSHAAQQTVTVLLRVG